MGREKLIELLLGILDEMPTENIQTVYIFALHYAA